MCISVTKLHIKTKNISQRRKQKSNVRKTTSDACPSTRVADSVSGCANRLTNAMGANTTPCRINTNEQFRLLRPIWCDNGKLSVPFSPVSFL